MAVTGYTGVPSKLTAAEKAALFTVDVSATTAECGTLTFSLWTDSDGTSAHTGAPFTLSSADDAGELTFTTTTALAT